MVSILVAIEHFWFTAEGGAKVLVLLEIRITQGYEWKMGRNERKTIRKLLKTKVSIGLTIIIRMK